MSAEIPRSRLQFAPIWWVWKSRLPTIVIPVLTTLRRFPGTLTLDDEEGIPHSLQLALIFIIALTTGFYQIPFSVTWWCVLLAAFALETRLMLGVATIMSLSVLLGWYGVQFKHPHAIMALWGGSVGEKEGRGKTVLARTCWRMWDLCVHAFPAVLMLCWHGPSVNHQGETQAGTVCLESIAAALPMNLLWLWGLRAGMSQEATTWALRLSFTDSNWVYKVVPDLPKTTWEQIHCVHWVVCLVWGAALTLHREVLLAYGIFSIAGILWWPFTNAWWLTFIISIVCGDRMPIFTSICWCSAAPVCIAWYGVQCFYPYVFQSLAHAWAVQPVKRFAPLWFSDRWLAFAASPKFSVAARVGDLLLHMLPTLTAAFLFRSSANAVVALISLPGNLVYLASFAFAWGARGLADTNWIYGVTPNIPNSAWLGIFAVHWIFCVVVFSACHLFGVGLNALPVTS